MKRFFFFVVLVAALNIIGCKNQNHSHPHESDDHGTHQHEDGATHQNHSPEDTIKQEEFKVSGDTSQMNKPLFHGNGQPHKH